MKKEEQLTRLYKIQEDIRIVQESGLWEPLHDAKLKVIKLIKELEGYCGACGAKPPTKSEANDESNNF